MSCLSHHVPAPSFSASVNHFSLSYQSSWFLCSWFPRVKSLVLVRRCHICACHLPCKPQLFKEADAKYVGKLRALTQSQQQSLFRSLQYVTSLSEMELIIQTCNFQVISSLDCYVITSSSQHLKRRQQRVSVKMKSKIFFQWHV